MRPLHLSAHLVSLWVCSVLSCPTGDSCHAMHPGERVIKELGPQLSQHASIVLPSSDEGSNLLVRASTPRVAPAFVAIVEVATEQDVQKTIRYANEKSKPFLAVSGAHGWPLTLNNVKNGIQINMRKLNSTAIAEDGNTATIGGGALQWEITSSLFKQQKQAVTGICECTSGIGPLLGGGHSMLQNRHGFAADNLVSARVALADGSVVRVAENENADLFWAIRGAGHNFGIVTSYELKLYDASAKWNMTVFSFTQDKLEDFFSTWNHLEQDIADPGLLLLNGVMARNPEVDKNYPLINLQVIYEGADTAIDTYTTAFRKLGPVFDQTTKDIAWGDLFEAGGFGKSSQVCRKNENILGYPNSFESWDVQGMRRGFSLYTNLTADPVFTGTAWLLESYGRVGVRNVPADFNAVAPEERQRHLLTSPMLWWKGDNEGDQQKAMSYGSQIQKAIRGEDVVPHMYVNYAMGSETVAETYGRDQSRVQRLRQLKAKWDPKDRFGFYNPLTKGQ